MGATAPAAAALTAAEVAALVGGTLIGQGDVPLTGVASLARAGPADLTFAASRAHGESLQACRAGAVIVSPELARRLGGPAARIVVPDPYRAFARAMRRLVPPPRPSWGIHPSASIGRGVRWRGRIRIDAFAVVGDGASFGEACHVETGACIGPHVRMGNACRVGAGARIGAQVVLGNGVRIKAGARVGGSGFGFVREGNAHIRIPHVGGLVVGDDVEIGANATVDRGKLDPTVIGAGTKLDNLVHVAHSVSIGERCVIAAQVGIAGSTLVEDDVLIAGQAGLADHVRVGRGARVAAQSGVIGDVPRGATVSGYPARPHRQVLRQAAALARLAPVSRALERLASGGDGA